MAAAAAGRDVAWEARTGPRQTQTCHDTPNTVTVERQSVDYTTANQTTTSHSWCCRAGLESHDSKSNNNEGSPRLKHPTHILTLTMH